MSAQKRRDDYNREAEAPALGRPLKYHHWYKSVSANSESPAPWPEAETPVRLSDLLHDLWQARASLFAGAVIGFVCAVMFCSLAVPAHRASAVLSPAKPLTGADFSAGAQDGNSSLIGQILLRAGVGNSGEFTRFETMAKGPAVAAQLLQDRNIATGLAHDAAFRFSSPETDWNAGKLSEYLNKRLHLESVGSTGMRRMSYSHPDPAFAAYLLGKVQTVTDSMIRSAARKETAERIDYLQKNLKQTNNPDHRRALTTLLLEQERERMLVSIDQPYAAEIIEPPSPSVKPVWPDKKMVFSALIMACAFLGFVIHNLRHSHARPRP